jgi:WD40 repeat protein
MLATGYMSGKIYLIDVENKKITTQAVLEKMHVTGLAWSPDGRTVAVRQIGSENKIRLYSFPKFHQIAERQQQVVTKGVCFYSPIWPAMSFTPDSSALWIGCDTRPSFGPQLAAVKLNARTLEQEDRLLLETPVADREADVSNHGRHMEIVNGVLRYSVVVNTYSILQNGVRHVERHFVYICNLNTKSPLTPRMEIPRDDRGVELNDPRKMSISGDGKILAASMPVIRRRSNVAEKQVVDHAIEFYRLKDGVRFMQLGGHGKKYGEYAFGFFLSNTNVFAIVSASKGKPHELSLLDVNTNEVVHLLALPRRARYYPSRGSRLAIVMGDRVDIYRLITN